MVYCFTWSIFYFIAACVLAAAAAKYSATAGWAVAAVRFSSIAYKKAKICCNKLPSLSAVFENQSLLRCIGFKTSSPYSAHITRENAASLEATSSQVTKKFCVSAVVLFDAPLTAYSARGLYSRSQWVIQVICYSFSPSARCAHMPSTATWSSSHGATTKWPRAVVPTTAPTHLRRHRNELLSILEDVIFLCIFDEN